MSNDDGDHRPGDLEYSESGLSVGVIIAGILAVAAIIFALQNSEEAQVDFLVFSATVPLSLVIILSLILGAILGWFVGYMRRRRRRKRGDE